jgi:uncharacterized membrane protein YphA (DoxX/SURF4 family)
MDELSVASRFALGTVFLLSGLVKLPNRDGFERVVHAYGLVPDGMSHVVARTLPPLEVALGGLLLTGLASRLVALVAGLLLCIFTVAVLINLLRGRRISCGCFGSVAQKEISGVGVARNLLFLAFAVTVAANPGGALSIDSLFIDSSEGLSARDSAAMLIAGTLGMLTLALVQQTISVIAKLTRYRRIQHTL